MLCVFAEIQRSALCSARSKWRKTARLRGCLISAGSLVPSPTWMLREMLMRTFPHMEMMIPRRYICRNSKQSAD